LNGATFSVAYDEMVIVKDIVILQASANTICCRSSARAPRGLSAGQTCSRAQQDCARGQHVCAPPADQERLTSQIAKSIEEKIAPQGVGVIIEARHLCMQMRGVEKTAWLGGD